MPSSLAISLRASLFRSDMKRGYLAILMYRKLSTLKLEKVLKLKAKKVSLGQSEALWILTRSRMY
jgi:hypothetical protein